MEGNGGSVCVCVCVRVRVSVCLCILARVFMNLLRCEHVRSVAAMPAMSCPVCGKPYVETAPGHGSEVVRPAKRRRLAEAGMSSPTSDGVTYFIVPFEYRLFGIPPMTQVQLVEGRSGNTALALFVVEDTKSCPRRAIVYRLDTQKVCVVHVYAGL